MSIKEMITADLKTAMKAKDSATVQGLRLVQSAMKNLEIEKRPEPLTEADATSVLKKLVKQRKDSIEQFQKADRKDLVEVEQAELAIMEKYLPQQMSEDQVTKCVDEALKETGATSMKDMGAVMKAVMEKTQGNADNKLVSQLVRSKLS